MKALILVAILCISARVVMSRTDSGCPAGYYNKNNNQCVACTANCKTCTAATTKDCSECATGFSKWLGDDLGCVTNSVQCKAFCDIENTIICTGCADGYYNLQNVNKTAIGICDSCLGKITNCKMCSDDKTCSACISAFYFDTTAKTCKACSTGCDVCTSASTCDKCKAGYAKSASGSCSACGSDCAECNDQKTAECSKCNVGAFLNATAKTCKVIAGCEEGADDKCTKCLDGFRLKSDGTCLACSGASVWLCNSTSDTAESIIACKVGFVKTIGGTTTTAVACKAVIVGCSVQNSDDKCTACESGRVLHNGTCPVCSAQFTGCSACADGSATTEGKCTACNAIGFYNSGSATAVACTACAGNCQTCTASGCSACNANAVNTATAPAVSCTLCDANATGCTDTLNVSGCKAGYVSGAVEICRACKDAQCKTCATYDSCTACNDGYSVQSGACVKCDANCTVTPTCSVKGKDKCDAEANCKSGTYITLAATDSSKADTCQACDPNCGQATCTGRGGACADGQCKAGYGTDTTTKKCVACSKSECATCAADYTKCNTCKTGYGLQGTAGDAAATCVICKTGQNCAQCDHATAVATAPCTACAESQAFETPNCVTGITNCAVGGHKTTNTIKTACTTCKTGYNPDAAEATTCTICTASSNCATCTTAAKPGICATCPTGRGLATAATADVKLCVLCSANCKSCTGADTDGKCVKGQCDETYGIYAGVTLLAACTACPSKNCATCDTAANKCDSCVTNAAAQTYLKQDKSDCTLCTVGNCLTCENGDGTDAKKGADRCKTCKPNHFLNTEQTTCTSCSGNCVTCSSATVCSQCESGYALISNACVACGSSCATCTVAGGCDSCKAGFILNSSTSTKTCDPCAANCTGCTVRDTCDGGSCTGAWGKTSGITKKQTLCFECSTNCATCTVDNKQVTSCTKCNAGYYLDAAKVCTKAGDDKCLIADGTSCTKCKYGFKLVSGSCTDCIADKTCPKQCSTGSTVVTPGTSNVTTTTTDDSSTILVFNAIILTILGFITHLLI